MTSTTAGEDMPGDFMPSVVEANTYAVHHWKIPAKVFTVSR